jgi:sulfate adenylyltransferase subunit 1
MDLVDFSQEQYDKIQESFEAFAAKLDVVDVHFIPISALLGDNVVTRSDKTSWYDGPTLMYYLENVHIASDHNFIDARFPVQFVIRPNTDEFHDYRGYAGRLAGGVMKKGDNVTLLPTGFSTKIKQIMGPDGEQDAAFPPQSVTVLLEDDLDLSRGDMIVRENNQPEITQDIEVMLCWFDSNRPLHPKGKYSIRHTSQDARCVVKEIRYKLNINSLHRDMEDKNINMNDIARVVLRTTKPLFVDSYRKNRNTGSVILIDEASNNTVAAGMII